MGDLEGVGLGQTTLQGEGNLLLLVTLATPGVAPMTTMVSPTNATVGRSSTLSKCEESLSRRRRWRSLNGSAPVQVARKSTSCMGLMADPVERPRSHSRLKQMQKQQCQSTDRIWVQGILNSSTRVATKNAKTYVTPLP